MTHELKTWPVYFDEIMIGTKTFELRKDDRNYKVGDYLLLQRYDPIEQKYTGEEIKVKVTYILGGGSFGLQGGNVIMSFKHTSNGF